MRTQHPTHMVKIVVLIHILNDYLLVLTCLLYDMSRVLRRSRSSSRLGVEYAVHPLDSILDLNSGSGQSDGWCVGFFWI
jgi:hypothetical protein